jgi:hypothetical protein
MAATASIAVDNSGGHCTGTVCLVYADFALDDADMWLVSSPRGAAGTWTAPVKAN